jgi:uncharacterized protein (TIGR02594 family)
MAEVMYENLTKDQADQLAFELEVEGTFNFEIRQKPDGTWTVRSWPKEGHPVSADRSGAETDEPAWLRFARAELGQAEVPGERSNQRIEQYHATTESGPAPDSVPWCSSFVNFCIQRAGLKGTGGKLARSWVNWGAEAPDFVSGCVVVLERPDHVAFYVGKDNERIRLLGGNQGDRVSVASFAADRVIAKRLPG